MTIEPWCHETQSSRFPPRASPEVGILGTNGMHMQASRMALMKSLKGLILQIGE